MRLVRIREKPMGLREKMILDRGDVMKKVASLALAVLMCSSVSWGQDYAREAAFDGLTRGKMRGLSGKVTWISDTKLWWREDQGEGKRSYLIADVTTGKREPAFDHGLVASQLSTLAGRPIAADRLLVDAIEFEAGGAMKIVSAGRVYRLVEGKLSRVEGEIRGMRVWAPAERGRPTRSNRTGPGTRVIFQNRLGTELNLYWLDDAGERQPYGTVPANGEREMNTYAGHAWLLTEKEGGREVAVVRAEDEEGIAVVPPVGGPQTTRPAPEVEEEDDGLDFRPDAQAAPFVLQQTSQPTQAGGQGTGRRRGGMGMGMGLSPDRKWRVQVAESNLRVVNAESGETVFETTDATTADGYRGQAMWSPDSSAFVVMRVKPGEGRKIHIVESSPRDQRQPKLLTLDYAKPGDRVDIERPVLFKVAGTTITKQDIATELYSNPYDISWPRWKADSAEFSFVYNQRGHQVLRVVGVDAKTGTARSIVDETSKTFVCYSHKQFAEYLDETNEIVWMSERDGYNHLYLYDRATGTVKNQITKGEWVVRGVDRVDAKTRQIYFRASGMYADQDPYFIHYGRVNFDGTGLTWLTSANGNQEIMWNPGRTHFVATYSRVDMAPVAEVRDAEGKKVMDLTHADASELIHTGWKAPEPFVAKARDGKTDIWGVIYRPTNFEAGKKYPVIEMIYAGPQDSFVPKTWAVSRETQKMAELGFILVQIDGMGTSNRSKAFHDVCWKNLGDSGFPDRILWMKAAAARYPEMDITRVGVYGGSAGGQSAARAVMKFGDFYKAAVADCGCHDNQMDKIWWNEQWMGWPIGPEYDASSNVVAAKELTGKLLLLVGELDQNVDPASTMQVVDALIRADKDFEMLVIPGGGHGAGGAPYGRKRRIEFFARHLLGK